MKNRIVGVLAITAALGLCSVPAWAQYDNTNDDVSCQTITKGVIKLKPALNNVAPTVPQVLQVGGTLGACTSTTNPNLVFPEGKSKFKGTLTISSPSGCAGLVGSSGATGDLTFTFSATDNTVPASPQAILHKTTILHIPAGGTVGGVGILGNGSYGQFGLGTAHGGVALSITDPIGGTSGFKGGDSGATSEGLIFTQQAVATLFGQCALLPPLGIKAINIGVGEIHLQ